MDCLFPRAAAQRWSKNPVCYQVMHVLEWQEKGAEAISGLEWGDLCDEVQHAGRQGGHPEQEVQ